MLLGSQLWTCRGSDAATEFVRDAEHPRLHERRRPAARSRPATPITSTRPDVYAFQEADVILIVGTPFDFRMGYGKRLSRTRP